MAYAHKPQQTARKREGFLCRALLAESDLSQQLPGPVERTAIRSEQATGTRLENPLILAKLSESLRLMATKVLGIIKLTLEFCCTFWEVLGLDLAAVSAESKGHGELPLSRRRPALTLLPRKGNPHNLRNWRSCLTPLYRL